MPEIASMREDFSALCHLMTTMAGISRYTSALVQYEPMITDGRPDQGDAPDSVNASKKLEHALSSRGSDRPTAPAVLI
jgi:hypothetical protein